MALFLVKRQAPRTVAARKKWISPRIKIC